MIAFFCRTPMHVFRTVQLKLELYPNEGCKIFVFDTFPGSKEMCERIKNTGLFEDVLFFCDSDYLKRGKASELRTTIESSGFKSYLKNEYYDEIYLYNVYGAFNELIFNVLHKKNKSLIVNMVEDGPSIYHIESYDKGFFRRYVYSLIGLKSYLEKIDYWWFSKPELMDPLYNGEKKELPSIDKTNKQMVDAINSVFAYDYDSTIAKADFLIMEECYWNDGLMPGNDDYQLFMQLKKEYNDKKIVVKLHPRTKVNRFKRDFDTVEANGIPWEVYALNMEMENKILVSLSCATMISSKLLYGEETFSLLLYPIIEDRIIVKDTGEKYLTEDRKRKIDSQAKLYVDGSKFVKAKTVDQAIKTLNNWLKRCGVKNEN